jgi:cyclase
MLAKRIIPCLDVTNGRVVKGVNFVDLIDAGDPVEAAIEYNRQSADELVFLDITATSDNSSSMYDVISRTAAQVFIPLTVGGGIRTVEDMRKMLNCGADKVSINSAAIYNPQLIADGAKKFGNQCIVLGMDVKHVGKSENIPSGYEIVINGGRKYMGMDALAWAIKAQELGAGEICLNSIDADGTKDGYELTLTELISSSVDIPVIASGGAGHPVHLRDVLKQGKADAALIASMVHYGTYTIPDIKSYLDGQEVKVRSTW